MNRYIVTFDKSNEDIPTLIVGRESYFSLNPGMDIIRVVTGSEAVRIWNELTSKTESEGWHDHRRGDWNNQSI